MKINLEVMTNKGTKPWLPQTSAPDVTFYNANLIDVEYGTVIPNTIVRISNGRIAGVWTGTQRDVPVGSNAVDLQGQYICPGLIDCHVHMIATPGSFSLKDLFAASPTTIAYRTAYNARQMLLRGFTTARDTGGADAALRDAIAEGLVIGPRLFIAGKALSQTGGHGDSRPSYESDHKCCGGHSPTLSRVCNGVPECLAAVRDELRQGANFIKIMGGGGVASPSDTLNMIQFTAEEIRAITTTAKQSKTYVTAHAYTIEAIRHVVDNGVLGIEHGNFIDEETALYCKERGVTFTPTLVTYQGMTEPPFDQFLDEDGQRKNREVLAGGLGALRILSKVGARICFGSDLLGGLHSLQSREFSIRSSVLTPKEILQSATINAARLLGKEDELGCIKKGSIADILILKSNPLQDITILDHIQNSLVAILKDGRVVFKNSNWLSVDPIYDPCHIQGSH
ncbi:amidohydrolase [Penicillium taxi]|uniref:amidohydrolase n=1 Tax=Penicillium taxi TaxID=168475 RepID=UPI002545AA5C|nr:amidohydrolase [Penicillium taxi]KAJ5887727.1 amidohydrolase [Penicillium taxi]